jgi:DNA-binding NtrC family response regulator
MVKENTFRGDLFYRLNVFPITVPPLRDRPEDILPLARHFLLTLRPKAGARFTGFDRDAERLLVAYPWPGNVRELRNVVERALVLERGTEVGVRSLMLDGAGEDGSVPPDVLLGPGIAALEAVERELIARAMKATAENTTRAAELLGLTRDQLRYRLKKFGTKHPEAED